MHPGITGIVGNNLARTLLAEGWQLDGLSRRPTATPHGTRALAADLLHPDSLRAALQGAKPTHVFVTS